MKQHLFSLVATLMGAFGFLSCGAQQTVGDDTFTTANGKMVRIVPYYHACLMIDCDGYKIQVDPVANAQYSYDNVGPTSLILITHEHGDHFNKATVAKLRGADTKIIANPDVAKQIEGSQAMSNGDTLTLANGIHIKAVPAFNITPGHTQYHPKGRDDGYIIIVDDLTIYVAGDTEDIGEMADLKGKVDIAFLPCNQPYTMTPEQLVKVARIIQPKILYPYHYGDTDLSGVAAQLGGIDVRMRGMK